MSDTPLHIRRCRRTDFTAVMQLLADRAAPAPLPERRTLHRFRAIVNDLGSDLYVAVVDGTLAAVVHATYVRQLAGNPRARLERLLVAQRFRRRGIGTALFSFVRERAIRRGCGTLDCLVPPRDVLAAAFLEKVGLHADGQSFLVALSPDVVVHGGA